ncbi:CDP-glucose 4,6-dehydratase [Solilutibacter silvestris]|uniref:CDP-glucose 4,6-dehydratase n=1 Tax=Solilutibacter silvestris TaxID=1645665 RepID=A0A2K1Q2P0_9GAMM|nr:CDP-glucose 4,6-dehydratase [Lysobacter silvestris]PNS09309.1 CDP-glucose 4,6-dehydratase [Lysobacter silvestris]
MALNLFNGIYADRRVLVTGHTGFKGSWLVLWLRALGAQVAGLALDPDTHPSHWSLLALGDVTDYRVDLRDAQAVRGVLDAYNPEIVFHLAAQPLVRRSYRDPATTFASNVMGLVNLFEAARTCPSVRVLINATTDKVYAEHASHESYRETDPLGGHDPYSSSKACAELVSDCYRKSFFGTTHSDVHVATARAGNVIGGGDWAEDRLVPDLERAISSGQPLQIRSPFAIRPWQHVLEPLSGYLRLAQCLWNDGSLAGAWNFGPGPAGEISVQSLIEGLATQSNTISIQPDGGTHPHEAATLRLNVGKAHQLLAWRPVWDIEVALARTAAWYHDFRDFGNVNSANDLAAYIDDACKLGLEWGS